MSSYTRAKELYLELKDLAPDARDAYLRAQSGIDAELERTVHSLLQSRDAHPAFVEAHPGHPETVNDYRIQRLLGSGAMGAVYLAEQADTHASVALKLMHRGLASGPQRIRFQIEAETLGRLRHPGIAQVYESQVIGSGTGEQPYLVMEYVPGTPLTTYAAERDLSRDECLRLLIELCDALGHAHQKGVVHRDLKPDNILVTDAGKVKLVDFGLALLLDHDKRVTLDEPMRHLVGTLQYMSPEQTSVGGEVDTQADVYAIGMIACELLRGTPPYALGDLPLPAALVAIQQEPPDLRGLPRELRLVLEMALAKDPDNRYANAAALGEDLQRYRNHEPLRVAGNGPLYTARKFLRRNGARVLVTTVVLILLAAMGYERIRANAYNEWGQQQQRLAGGFREWGQRQNRLAGGFRGMARVVYTMLNMPDEQPGQHRDTIIRRRLAEIEANMPRKNDLFARAQVLGQVGLAYRDLGEFERGYERIMEGIEICEGYFGDDFMPVTVAEFYQGAASCLLELNRYEEALDLFAEAEAITVGTKEKINAGKLAAAFHWKAEVELAQSQLDAALANAERALDLLRNAPIPAHNLGSQYDLVGRIHLARGELALAETHLATALSMRTDGATPGVIYTAKTHAAYADCLWELGEVEQACDQLSAALSIRETTLGDDHPDLQHSRARWAERCQP